ncbi:hypothetical protein LBSG162_00820 [Lentilactobacillus buchneri subsp. silagei]|nr:hypothetical protein Ltb232_07180 [Lentilactobacillus buchneri subsp. silagei]GED90977.1 hypothetical protein LBSG162_00820 [Lentilactobacillus buchneri subsp. silagei]GED93960.1 hypothetical protein LBSP_05200 [Lentilactobacillus buchneri subsp. silagei]
MSLSAHNPSPKTTHYVVYFGNHPQDTPIYSQNGSQSIQLFVTPKTTLSVIQIFLKLTNPRVHAIMQGTSKSAEYTIY